MLMNVKMMIQKHDMMIPVAPQVLNLLITAIKLQRCLSLAHQNLV